MHATKGHTAVHMSPYALIQGACRTHRIDLILLAHADEAEAAGLAGGRIPHDADLLHAAVLAELVLHILRWRDSN